MSKRPSRSGHKTYRPVETYAIWLTFKHLADEKSRSGPKWTLYPEDGPYSGEYLVDWALFENDYGLRIACESQWGTNLKELEWAFDKLRGVKSDVKVLIYERKRRSDPPDQEVRKVLEKYLKGYCLLSQNESFLFIEFDKGRAASYVFRPSRDGKQENISFTPLALQ
jgi:hypothetical protein